MSAMHLIRFASKKAHRAGLMVLLNLPVESLGLPDSQFVVMDEHIRALEEAKVPFTYLSKTAKNGTQPTSIQS